MLVNLQKEGMLYLIEKGLGRFPKPPCRYPIVFSHIKMRLTFSGNGLNWLETRRAMVVNGSFWKRSPAMLAGKWFLG